jgi:hypothetical protein
VPSPLRKTNPSGRSGGDRLLLSENLVLDAMTGGPSVLLFPNKYEELFPSHPTQLSTFLSALHAEWATNWKENS